MATERWLRAGQVVQVRTNRDGWVRGMVSKRLPKRIRIFLVSGNEIVRRLGDVRPR